MLGDCRDHRARYSTNATQLMSLALGAKSAQQEKVLGTFSELNQVVHVSGRTALICHMHESALSQMRQVDCPIGMDACMTLILVQDLPKAITLHVLMHQLDSFSISLATFQHCFQDLQICQRLRW